MTETITSKEWQVTFTPAGNGKTNVHIKDTEKGTRLAGQSSAHLTVSPQEERAIRRALKMKNPADTTAELYNIIANHRPSRT